MTDLADRLRLAVEIREWAQAAAALAEPLVVVTTPAGAADALAADVPPGGAAGVLFDVVYDPWPTPLAAAWQAAGGQVVGGLDLLVHQAARQVELMTGMALDLPRLVAAMTVAGEAVLAERAATRGGSSAPVRPVVRSEQAGGDRPRTTDGT
jgi:shikimate dehydrogenase